MSSESSLTIPRVLVGLAVPTVICLLAFGRLFAEVDELDTSDASQELRLQENTEDVAVLKSDMEHVVDDISKIEEHQEAQLKILLDLQQRLPSTN